MKIQIASIAMLLLAGSVARADIIITLDAAAQTGSPGDTLIFSGTLFNSSSDTIFLNGADLNLAGNSFTPDFSDPFIANVPVSLDPGQGTSDIELFEVVLNDPFTDPFTSYDGDYALSGGADPSAQGLLTSADFTITAENRSSAVPEPSSLVLLATALAGFVVLRSALAKRHSNSTSGSRPNQHFGKRESRASACAPGASSASYLTEQRLPWGPQQPSWLA
jgi:hypothetical protein